jgi:hypothetical protein
MMMVEAKQSYKERMREARAAARAQRLAEKAAQQRRTELIVTARMIAMDAVKETIRARGDKVQHYTYAELHREAEEMMRGPWLMLKAREKVAQRQKTIHILHQSVTSRPRDNEVSQ